MKRAFFTIADKNNLKYYEMMKNSLGKFHPNEELVLFDDIAIQATKDPQFFYRSTPYVADLLFNRGYDQLCKLDADQIITGDLSSIWEGDFDAAVVNNSNPREHKAYPYTVWNIHPYSYVNNGLVVLKNPKFASHWKKLCYSTHFNYYQMKEQDLLNIMVFYGDHKVKFLDAEDKFYGLASKGYWPDIILKNKKELVLPANQEWNKIDKTIKVLHWAGGANAPDKMNYRLRFKPEVIRRLDELVK